MFFTLGSSLSVAQDDSIQYRNLDSLYIAWAEGRLLIPVELIDNTDIMSYSGAEGSDSLYKARLAAIPTVIELTYNSNVKQHIEMYVEKRRKQVELMLGLAEYYFPIFEEILMEEGLPLELKYMPVIESGLNPVASSRAGAQGLWQFMYGTAKSYGLEVNSFVDERWDPVKSSRAAAAYLKDLFDIYGDWYLVIAAYNCGPGNVNKAIARSGGKRNYWDIYYHLPKETRGYAPAFIAAIYAMNFHHVHGLVPAESEYPEIIDTVWIERDIHFKQVAAIMDVPIGLIQKLNPQYRRDIIPSAGGPYAIRLPFDLTTQFVSLEDSIANYNRSVYFSQANLNKTPKYTSYIPDPPKGDFEAITYSVKSGDNLGYIAAWYDVGLSKLKYWNNIYGNRIRVGQKLKIYIPKGEASKYADINDLSFDEKQAREGKVTIAAAPLIQQDVNNEGFSLYTVKSGDNLWSIAKSFPGISTSDIMNLNGMKDSKLQIGQVLKIRSINNLP